MFSSTLPTPPQSYNPVFYSPSEASHDDFSIPSLQSDFASPDSTSPDSSLLKKRYPYSLPTPPPSSLLSSQFEAPNMAGQNIQYQRAIPGARVTEYADLDPWYTCMYQDYQDSAAATRPTVSTAYSSPPTLSLSTNILGGIGANYSYSAHPDSGIQVTPHTALSAKFGSGPPSATGMNMHRPSTPASGNSPMPLLASSYTSSVSDAAEAWEAHQSMRHVHQIDRAATFDTSSWRIPAYPDLNVVQPTPINTTSSHHWPSPGSQSLKHRSTALADAVIAGRGSRWVLLWHRILQTMG